MVLKRGQEGAVRRLVLAAGCLSALLVVTIATAMPRRTANIEPWHRVHGMLVVQGGVRQADGALFGVYCRPDIVKSGRYRRTCVDVPRSTRLFVGYGLFAAKEKIDRVWNATAWSMWIDGEQVSLDSFGTTDQTLYRYPPAGGRDVTLREWSVTLMRAPPGRHTIRYRLRLGRGTIDATWEFRIVGS